MGRQETAQELLDLGEASKYMRLSSSFIRKSAKLGHVSRVKIGKRVFFRKTDLDAWIAASTQGPSR